MKKAHITCPYCHAPAQLRPASSIYGIHTKDRTAKLYVCSRYDRATKLEEIGYSVMTMSPLLFQKINQAQVTKLAA